MVTRSVEDKLKGATISTLVVATPHPRAFPSKGSGLGLSPEGEREAESSPPLQTHPAEE